MASWSFATTPASDITPALPKETRAMEPFRFDAIPLSSAALETRAHVRDFIRKELDGGSFSPRSSAWTDWNADFSRRVGEAGFIGMTWPKAFGGHERTALERFIVNEELLAVGAPCMAHWIADRQSGPQIIKFGSQQAKAAFLPGMVAGRCYAAIGMSEPDSGSDLASIRTRAVRCDGGWIINGTKVWTSNAHLADFAISLIRTEAPGKDRHAGMTQFILRLDAPGVDIKPIRNLAGVHEFNQTTFTDYFVGDDMVLGAEGRGWSLVTHELVYERSSPDRFMSDYTLLRELIDHLGPSLDERQSIEIGRLVAHLAVLRRMSMAIAGDLAAGREPALAAAVVKDIGTSFEQEVPDVVRRLVQIEADGGEIDNLAGCLARAVFYAPAFTIRGGTREILRNIIARELELR